MNGGETPPGPPPSSTPPGAGSQIYVLIFEKEAHSDVSGKPEYAAPRYADYLGDQWHCATSRLLSVNAIRTQLRGDPINFGSDTTDSSWQYGWRTPSPKEGGGRENHK